MRGRRGRHDRHGGTVFVDPSGQVAALAATPVRRMFRWWDAAVSSPRGLTGLAVLGGVVTAGTASLVPGPAAIVGLGLVGAAFAASRVARRVTAGRLLVVSTLPTPWRARLSAAALARRRALAAAARTSDRPDDVAALDAALTTTLCQAARLLLDADHLVRDLSAVGGEETTDVGEAVDQAHSRASELLTGIEAAATAAEQLARVSDRRRARLREHADELRLSTFRAGLDPTVEEFAARHRQLAQALRRLEADADTDVDTDNDVDLEVDPTVELPD